MSAFISYVHGQTNESALLSAGAQISEKLLGFIKNALMSWRLPNLGLLIILSLKRKRQTTSLCLSSTEENPADFGSYISLSFSRDSPDFPLFLTPGHPFPWIRLVPSRALLSNRWQSPGEVLYEWATQRPVEACERSFPFPFWSDVDTLLSPSLLLSARFPLLPGVRCKHQVHHRWLRSELSRSDAAHGDAFKRHLLASSMKSSANNRRCVYKCSADLVAQM